MKTLINSLKYVIIENSQNIYRIFCIVKYEILAENRDSKLGMLWSILDPLIQIISYWFAFARINFGLILLFFNILYCFYIHKKNALSDIPPFF